MKEMFTKGNSSPYWHDRKNTKSTVNDRLSTLLLIRERHLFDCGAYFKYRQNTERIPGIWRELSEVHTRYAQFNIKYCTPQTVT